MKYAFFALGLLLLLIGGYSVLAGVAIIDVERGWSSVIAGTTAFVGGLVVVGLGWIIKTLEDLPAAMSAQVAAIASGVERKSVEHEGFADTPIAPMAWPPHPAPVPAQVPVQALAVEESGFAESESFAEPEMPARTAPGKPSYVHAGARAAAAEPPPAAGPGPSPIKDLWRRVAKEIDTRPVNRVPKWPTAPRPAVAPQVAPQAAQQAAPNLSAESHTAATPAEAEPLVDEVGDWLDHAFADLNASLAKSHERSHQPDAPAAESEEEKQPRGLPGLHSQAHRQEPHLDLAFDEPAPPLAPEPTHDHLVQDREAQDLLKPEHFAPGEETQHEPAHNVAPDEHPQERFVAGEAPAVIGRYEAEGTSYVMFADGSIEAQSERGVAHFKSMAELKAYFENQEAQ